MGIRVQHELHRKEKERKKRNPGQNPVGVDSGIRILSTLYEMIFILIVLGLMLARFALAIIGIAFMRLLEPLFLRSVLHAVFARTFGQHHI